MITEDIYLLQGVMWNGMLYDVKCLSPGWTTECDVVKNIRFPEITGEDSFTMFFYSGRVKSPEWRRQRRRADLRQF